MGRVVFLILIFYCTGLQVTVGNKHVGLTKGIARQAEPAFELEPEKKKRKSPRQGALRMRNKIFTVNLLRFNKKIRAKHDKEAKALAKYEERLRRRKAKRDAKNPAGFEVKIKRKGRGPAVKQRKSHGN